MYEGGALRNLLSTGLSGLGELGGDLMTNKYGGGVGPGYKAGMKFGGLFKKNKIAQLKSRAVDILGGKDVENLEQGLTYPDSTPPIEGGLK